MNRPSIPAIVLLSFVLGVDTLFTLGLAVQGSPLAVLTGLFGLLLIWLIHLWMPEDEPVTRLTAEDRDILMQDAIREMDKVMRMPRVMDAFDKDCPACGGRNSYSVYSDGSGSCSRCAYIRLPLPE